MIGCARLFILILLLLFIGFSTSYAGSTSSSSGISNYLTEDITPLLSMAGIWEPVNTVNDSVVDFWGVARLGVNQLQGVVLSGWSASGFNTTAAVFTRVSIAVLAQQSDGTLKLATNQYLPSAVTNGAGSVVIADFNGDGQDDIFLAAHNEAPLIPKASTVYLSKPDSTFTKITLSDSVEAHDANLASINGQPTVLTAGFNQPMMPNPIYTYNGQGGFNINNSTDDLSAMSVGAADFLGNGGTEIVYGDMTYGPNYPWTSTNVMQQFIYNYVNGQLTGDPVSLPAPYFNNKPQYSQYVSNWDPVSKTHNSRLWVDDINHDGKPDIVVGEEIWDSTYGTQKRCYSCW